ncbi:MAG: hypothetical protein NVV82_13790 [Sporocytophaga sp.]|nr:hypothetical protein [Sporocytophaga sp.]
MMETRGWIEYRPYYAEKERNEDYPWLAWMSIDSVIDSVDEITETLFGYSKRIIRKEFEVHALAKNRGIPDNASDVVKWEVETICADRGV